MVLEKPHPCLSLLLPGKGYVCFANQSVMPVRCAPGQGHFRSIPQDDKCNRHAKDEDASNGAHDSENQLKFWKGKEKIRAVSYKQAPTVCLLHRCMCSGGSPKQALSSDPSGISLDGSLTSPATSKPQPYLQNSIRRGSLAR